MRLALDVEAQQSFEFLSEQVQRPDAAYARCTPRHLCFVVRSPLVCRCTASARPSRRSRTF